MWVSELRLSHALAVCPLLVIFTVDSPVSPAEMEICIHAVYMSSVVVKQGSFFSLFFFVREECQHAVYEFVFVD